MAFTGLLLKGVGPFERLWLDLSDGQGKAHLGPHVIAGVNGCGKSTVLKGLAWTLGPSIEQGGFPVKDWERSLAGWSESGAYSIYDRNVYGVSKPVVLLGKYQLPTWLEEANRLCVGGEWHEGQVFDAGDVTYDGCVRNSV